MPERYGRPLTSEAAGRWHPHSVPGWGLGGNAAGDLSMTAYNLLSMALAVVWMEPTRARMFPVSPLIPVI